MLLADWINVLGFIVSIDQMIAMETLNGTSVGCLGSDVFNPLEGHRPQAISGTGKL